MTPDTPTPLVPPIEVESILDAATGTQYAARFTETSVQLIAPDGNVVSEAHWPRAGEYSRNLQRNIASAVVEGDQ